VSERERKVESGPSLVEQVLFQMRLSVTMACTVKWSLLDREGY